MATELGLQANRVMCDTTFNEATQAWPDYAGIYFARANYLLPRWHGARGELATDLEKSADTAGGAAGDILYARVVWFLHHWVSSPNLFQEYGLSWNRTKKGFQALEKQYPDSISVENEAAHLAVIAGDDTAAREYFNQTGGMIDLSAWESTSAYTQFAAAVYHSGQ